MTDLEFDVLDELYFVNTFEGVLENIEAPKEKLLDTLIQLVDRNWIKCFIKGKDEVIPHENLDMNKNYKNYQYLATKEGLLAHNSK